MRTSESSKRFKRELIMWLVTGFVRPCSPATKRLSAWRGKSTGSKVPLSLARKRNSSGATWRLMKKNLHYVAEHTSAASNQGRRIIPRARQPSPTRSHRRACSQGRKSARKGQSADIREHLGGDR